MKKYIKLFFSIIIFVTLTLKGGDAFAITTSMEEVQRLFKREYKRDWDDVTRREKIKFLYKVRGKEEKIKRKIRVRGVKIPFYIREGYYRKYGQKWEQATKIEQEVFIKEYKSLQKDLENKQVIDRIEAKIKKDEYELEKRMKKLEIKIRKDERALEKRLEKIELERKRQEEKIKVFNSKQERNALTNKLREARMRNER